ncbi:hypothetical protein AVEN_200726-1 [Araneus ventricosus]|uniref:Uncharacterized protein n=1 Tax=Araneus ventricosus TaxID=182803 RepID=A0A4Y2R3Q3_ARAVE|nr:hypothetical protein AVEN_200726-1 [Araneus ventricosus]
MSHFIPQSENEVSKYFAFAQIIFRNIFEDLKCCCRDHCFADEGFWLYSQFGLCQFRGPTRRRRNSLERIVAPEYMVPLLLCTKFRALNVACFEMHAYPHHLRTVVQQDEFLTRFTANEDLASSGLMWTGLFAQKAVVPLRFEVG